MNHPYATLDYAKSLSHIGQAHHIPEWESSVLIRSVNNDCFDAIGTYPLAILSTKSDLKGGLERLREKGVITTTLVLDDFKRPDLAKITDHFQIVRPFKPHYIHDRSQSPSYSSHHRYYIKKALQTVSINQFDLKDYLEDWKKLYATLIERQSLSGIHIFPDDYHTNLAATEGLIAIGAWINDQLVSCHLYVQHDGVIHSHLAASTDQGYYCNAAYAINHHIIETYGSTHTINFGGGAGHESHDNDGLSRFKKGFCNSQAQSYICGAILDSDMYEKLCQGKESLTFFPAYRSPIRKENS